MRWLPLLLCGACGSPLGQFVREEIASRRRLHDQLVTLESQVSSCESSLVLERIAAIPIAILICFCFFRQSRARGKPEPSVASATRTDDTKHIESDNTTIAADHSFNSEKHQRSPLGSNEPNVERKPGSAASTGAPPSNPSKDEVLVPPSGEGTPERPLASRRSEESAIFSDFPEKMASLKMPESEARSGKRLSWSETLTIAVIQRSNTASSSDAESEAGTPSVVERSPSVPNADGSGTKMLDELYKLNSEVSKRVCAAQLSSAKKLDVVLLLLAAQSDDVSDTHEVAEKLRRWILKRQPLANLKSRPAGFIAPLYEPPYNEILDYFAFPPSFN